jgi:hypothetical protein
MQVLFSVGTVCWEGKFFTNDGIFGRDVDFVMKITLLFTRARV